MRALLLVPAAAAALALAACGDRDADRDANADMNAMAEDNMMLDQNIDVNAAGGMDGNMATDNTTENMMMNDLTTNDADTNLANGM